MRHRPAPPKAHRNGHDGPSTAKQDSASSVSEASRDGLSDALARMRRLFTGIPTGIVSTDLETGTVEVNPAMEAMFGYPAEEITPDSLLAWTHPDDRDTVALREEFDEGKRESYEVEKRYIRADGETIWCKVAVEYVRDRDGAGRSAIATFEDITERKAAEIALRRQADRLAEIVRIQRDVAAADLDLEAVMRLICKRTRDVVPCDGAVVMLVDGERLVFGADSRTAGGANGVHDQLKRTGLALEGSLTGWALLHDQPVLCNDMQKEPRADPVTARRDGVASIIVVPLSHGGERVGVLQIFSGRTDAFHEEDVRTLELLSVVLSAAMSHAAEFQAKRAEIAALARFRTIFEGASIGITRVDLKGRVLEANPAFERLVGYSTEELARLEPGVLTHPDDWDAHLEQHRAMVAGARDSYRIEKRYIRRDGEVVWCQLTTVLDRDAEGRPGVIISMIQDISDRKATEDRRLQAQKMEAIGQLSAGIAHDFNNLLMGVLGYTEIARGEVDPGSRAAGSLDKIAEAGERAASLTRQLLAFGRRQTLQTSTIQLNDLVSETVALLGRVVGEQIELVTRLDPELSSLKADPTKIQQVLFNLVLNARDAMPMGGRVTIETRDVELDERWAEAHPGSRSGPHVELTVTDEGIGMDAATRAHIFEPFFTTKPPGEGTGLGLATVYGIVEQSGGHLAVRSEAGRGTTFHLYFECHGEENVPRASWRPSAEEHTATDSKTILLVEDDPAVLSLVEEMLAGLGSRVLSATSPADALTLSARHDGEIDLLLTDVIMPGMSGRKLAEQLTAQRAGLRVLYTSGYARDAISTRGELNEGVHLLEKPFTQEALADELRRALNGG